MATLKTKKLEEKKLPAPKFYTCLAGRFAPEELEMGKLNPTTGLPDGKTQKIKMTVGTILMPNYSRVWGRRINEVSTEDTRSIEVTDKTYKGVIEFLEYGDYRGELLEIRYLPTSKSVDLQYQDQVQKLKPTDEDIFIVMEQGTNDYDPVLQKTLVGFLKVHSLNSESPSRDPDKSDFMFVEYSAASRKSKMAQIATRREAEAIVLEAENDELRLKVLANIIPNLNPKEQDDILVDKLLQRVDADPRQFLDIIQNYRKDVQEMMQYLMDEELLFLEGNEDNVQLIIEGKKQRILTGVEGDEKVKKQMWIINHMLEPNTFEAIKTMEAVKQATVQAAN